MRHTTDYVSPQMMTMLAIIKLSPRGFRPQGHARRMTAKGLLRRGLVCEISDNCYTWVADYVPKQRVQRVAAPPKPTHRKVLIHGRWLGEYLGVDEAAKKRGCRFYHKVRIANLVSNAGSDNVSPDMAGLQTIRCCDEEVGQ